MVFSTLHRIVNVDQLKSQGLLMQNLSQAQSAYAAFQERGLSLDITRGKPSAEQLDLSADLLTNVTNETAVSEKGVDTRNYGGLAGLIDVREIFAELLRVPTELLYAQGNSSLVLMAQVLQFHLLHDSPNGTAWANQKRAILCPVPGYDRHFKLAESLGFDLIAVDMDDEGPVLEQVAEHAQREEVKGIWIVPAYSNPTGINVSAERAQALAELDAAPDFRILWDNAYALHHLSDDNQAPVLDILSLCEKAGNPNRAWIFASTSKITHAGAGVAFIGSSAENMAWFDRALSPTAIGPDKVNHLRHARFFKDANGVREHMRAHAAILQPKFDLVEKVLDRDLGAVEGVTWTKPHGGYFVTLTVPHGTASRVVELAAEAGVKLTPAGSTHPYGEDPTDSVIRLAPSMPPLEELEVAMEGLVACVQLAVAEKDNA